MNPIAFVPAARALFIADAASENSSCGTPHALIHRLREQGWPTQARLLLPGNEQAYRTANGVMVELLDALPILAGAESDGELSKSRELQALAKLLRMALSATERAQAWPKIHRVGTGSRYMARWRAALTPSERTAVIDLSKDLRIVLAELPTTPLSSERWHHAVTGQRVAFLLVDASVDLLVREGCRRGAQVRLADCPASAWEQRLVHALSNDKALMLASTPSDETFAKLCDEANAWSKAALDGAARPLLPSPESWQASESLQQVAGRMLRQAGLLSTVMLAGRPAPRMLPTAAWRLETPTMPRKQAPLPRKLLDEALQLLRDNKPSAAQTASCGRAA